MSCFGGIMEEYKFLSIDRFDGINLSSSAFFLSHCHTDHMVGLDRPEFLERLRSRDNILLYCSKVTEGLLIADDKHRDLEMFIRPLAVEDPTIVEITDDSGKSFLVVVTLISAGHCPGSVMFLFEGNEGNILYTGDFRLPKGSAKRVKPFHTFSKAKKELKSVYVDTTFCSPNAIFIPSREDCIRVILNMISDWLKQSQTNAVRLNLSAKYGYEYLFNELYKKFKSKIYCKRKTLYRCLPKTFNILTESSDFARIFACFKTEKIESTMRESDELINNRLNFMNFTLSTLYFTHEALPHQIYEQISETSYRFCYSFHSSYSEVCDFVKYLNPGKIHANVIPYGHSSLQEAAEGLSIKCGFKSSYHSSHAEFTDVIPKSPIYSSNGQNSNPFKRVLSLSETDDDKDSDELWVEINKKAVKRDSIISNEVERTDNLGTISDPSKHEFTVIGSPESKAPVHEQIEALHVKIALNEVFSDNKHCH